jgi:hypothetical protein
MSESQTTAVQKPERALPVTTDASSFSNLLDSSKFDHMWRVAQMFSRSKLVPAHFQGQPESCFIAAQMAVRLGVDLMMLMQCLYIVHGKPGFEAKFATALINTSGLFVDPLEYEIVGTDPFKEDYKARAFAIRKSTGKRVEGPWVDWKMVKGEGWFGKDGSKWKTMPGVMFNYRAATLFARMACPERLLGMQTVDELQDSVLIVDAEPLSQGSADDLNRALAEPPVTLAGDFTAHTTPEAVSEPAKGAKGGKAGKPVTNAKPYVDFDKRRDEELATLDAAQLADYRTAFNTAMNNEQLTEEQCHDQAMAVVRSAMAEA